MDAVTPPAAQIDADVADSHWSAEQCLRAGCCAAVVHWLPDADYRQLRRLQLAAETGGALAFVFRPAQASKLHAPQAMSLSCRMVINGRRYERVSDDDSRASRRATASTGYRDAAGR